MKIKDLEPGMVYDDILVIAVEPKGTNPFWDEDCIRFFYLHDSGYYGSCSKSANFDDDVTIGPIKGTLAYDKILEALIASRVDAMMQAQNDIDLLRAYKK